MKYVIAYDLGTGGTKASLFNEYGKTIATTFEDCDTTYPNDKFHEQQPEIWWEIVKNTTQSLLHKVDIDVSDIVSIGVSGHSLGVVPLDKEGELLDNSVPIWSDSRAEVEAENFFRRVDHDEWYLTTGNGFPAPLYSIFKIMWYKTHKPELYDATYKFIGTKDYINYKLTNNFGTDFSYASGSGVYDLKKWSYQDQYVEASGVDKNKLPDIYKSDDIIGTLTKEAASALGLHEYVKVVYGGVDNACMALGAGCIREGMTYTSLGSSSWIAVSSNTPIVDVMSKPYVFTHCVPDQFVSATCIFSAGSSYKWVRDVLVRDLGDSDTDLFELMNVMAMESSVGSNKLIFNPSLAGGSSLDKSPNIKGAFIGLTLAHTLNDILRATLEGVCLNLRVALDVLREYVEITDDMLIVGGGSKSEFWRSLFADIYDLNVIQTSIGQSAGSLGAAALALVGSGLWDDYSRIKILHEIKHKQEPDTNRVKEYEKILKVFMEVSDLTSEIGDVMSQL